MSIKCNERGSAMMYISLNQLEQVYFTNTYAYIFVIVNTLLETKCFVALYMFIKVHRTNGFEIFSNPISLFFNILFSVQPPLCTYKRFFNTEKNPIYFDYMYIRINPKSFHARYSYLTQNVKLFV